MFNLKCKSHALHLAFWWWFLWSNVESDWYWSLLLFVKLFVTLLFLLFPAALFSPSSFTQFVNFCKLDGLSLRNSGCLLNRKVINYFKYNGDTSELYKFVRYCYCGLPNIIIDHLRGDLWWQHVWRQGVIWLGLNKNRLNLIVE